MPVFGAFPSDYKITGTNIDGGVNTLGFVTTGTYNIGLGNNSLALLTTGNNNIAIGDGSLSNETGGLHNVAIGTQAMSHCAGVGYNVGVGYKALSGTKYDNSPIAAIINGYSNTALGYTALEASSTGYGNVGVGSAALRGDIFVGVPVTGKLNVGIGTLSGAAISSGTHNVFIGYKTGYLVKSGSNNILIGAGSEYIEGADIEGTPSLSNTIQIGDASHTTVTIGGVTIESKPPIITVMTGGTPSGIPSSGSVAANGALTVTAAFLETYSDGVWLFFPAGAVYAGSVAGSYWVVMSSTTLGTVYDNVLVLPGSDHPPVTPTPIVAAGPGAYTQVVTTDITVRSVVMPGNTMGEDGMLTFKSLVRHNNSAGAKSWRPSINSTFFGSIVSTTSTLSNRYCDIYNRRNQSSQISSNWLGPQSMGVTDPIFGTENTSIDQTVSVALRIAVATDWIINLTAIVSAYYGVHP